MKEYPTKLSANQSLKITCDFAIKPWRVQSIEWQCFTKTPFIHIYLIMRTSLLNMSIYKLKKSKQGKLMLSVVVFQK